MNKKVGLVSKKAQCDITINKNFFVAGEIAYLAVRIDNSKVDNACSLIVNHSHKLKIMTSWRESSHIFVNKSEKYFLAHAG